MEFKDIVYEKANGIATITMNRPEVYNAFRPLTVKEMNWAFKDAWHDHSIGVVVLTGSGDKAFCTGGDLTSRDEEGYGELNESGERGELDVETLHGLIRDIPKPVIAAVNGYAIGGGHVLQVICDLTVASDKAIFGQVGPKVGSYDAGYGTAYLARIVGEKKAREIWYLCEQYSAEEALEMGLINKIVPHDKLKESVEDWCNKILEKSPTALKMLKYSFNADSANIHGITKMAIGSIEMYYKTDEALEGLNAFMEKRPADFKKFRK